MKLFELDIGSTKSVLSILQGRSAEKNDSGKVSYEAVMNLFKQFDLPLGGPDSDKQAILTALKNLVDPIGDVIDSINPPDAEFPNGSITLNTPNNNPTQPEVKGGSSLDDMASRAAQKAISQR